MNNDTENIKREFPQAPRLRKLLGPSFIILAMGLGSGEVILWPYLAANIGLGIAWGALLGITFQYFMNMEIERYALVKGESVFVGLGKLFKRAPYWFIISTFIGFGLPGIIAAAAQVLGHVVGITDFKWLAMLLLVMIGIILSAGKTVYGMMERITKIIISLGVPFIFILTVIMATSTDWVSLLQGLVGRGMDYNWLPTGLAMATFFAAFAYSGAGGNLNLTQSIYIKEKGYGMGKYAPKIAGLFKGGKLEQQQIKLSGTDFTIDETSINRFQTWWRRISWEHFLVFWLVGLLGMLFLMLLSYSTTYGLAGNAEGISFVINEGIILGGQLFPAIGVIFLIVVAVMLFQTQLGIMDSTSRIMAENLAVKKLAHEKKQTVNLSRIYYGFVWAQIIFGLILFAGNIYEPKTLIVLGAVINAVAMFVHVGLVTWLNYKKLPVVFQPRWWRRVILLIIFLFFAVFSVIAINDAWQKWFS